MKFSEIVKRLGKCTVGIAGAGGLGSNCAASLVRIGIGKLILADFDTVAESNLNRQFYFASQVGMKKVEALKENLLQINPAAIIEIHCTRLDPQNIPSIFRGCDVIVEAFDRAEEKQMLIETALTVFPEKPLVAGLGIAGYGSNDTLHCRQVDNLYICGDETAEIDDDLPPIAPRVGIVANMQANVVTELLLRD